MHKLTLDLRNPRDRITAQQLGLLGRDAETASSRQPTPPPIPNVTSPRFCFVLEGHTTPLNQLSTSVGAKIALKKGDRLRVQQQAQAIPHATGKRRVDITLIFPKGQRRCDKDAYWKSLLDALVANKLLVNDSPTWCEPGTVHMARGETARMFIELTEITSKD